MSWKYFVGIVLALVLSSTVLAIHTSETRYASNQNTIEQRNILQSENLFGRGFVKPFGGFGMKGASRGSFGSKGEEEGASNLATNAFIPRGRDPTKISNYYTSARGYRVMNMYIKLDPVDLQLTTRPQINGTPQGHVRLINRRPNELYLPEATIILRTRDLPPLNPNYVYEAWLVDEDTGASLSLGIFQSSDIGRIGTLTHKMTLSLDPFDTMMITTEPFPDSNPFPGQVVLAGALQESVART